MTEPDQPTVLVVEDEQALIELYVRWLDDEYDVRTANGGREALEHLVAAHPRHQPVEQHDVDGLVELLERLPPPIGRANVVLVVEPPPGQAVPRQARPQ